MAEKSLSNGHVFKFKRENSNLILTQASDHSHENTLFASAVTISGSGASNPTLTTHGLVEIKNYDYHPALKISSGGDDGDGVIGFYGGGTWIVGQEQGVDKFRIKNSNTITGGGNGLTIDGSNNNIGIGTDSPDGKIHIVGKSIFEGGSAYWSDTTPGLTTGTIHLDPGVSTNHHGGAITFGASDAGSGATAQAGIYVRSDATYGTKMYFGTTDSYASGSKVAMMIDDDRQVGIGTTSPSYKLDVKDSQTDFIARFWNSSTDDEADGVIIRLGPNTNPKNTNNFMHFQDGNGTVIGQIDGDGSGGTDFKDSSDIRRKKDIQPTKFGIADLLEIDIVDFKYKTSDVNRTGVIAQQAKKGYPPAVSDYEDYNILNDLKPGDEDFKYMTVAYAKYIPLLMKSLQDAYSKILELETRIDNMEDDNVEI